MKELIMDMYKGFVRFRGELHFAIMAIKEKLIMFYEDLGYKTLRDGIKGDIWLAIYWIIATLNMIACILILPVGFVIGDLPYIILRRIIDLNHWND